MNTLCANFIVDLHMDIFDKIMYQYHIIIFSEI